MEANNQREATEMRKLYEASLSGNVPALEALLKANELMLDRVSLTCFDETPLHIAALRGHLNFTKALLSRSPRLASDLDSRRRSPLHLASAAGHRDIVRELLRVSAGECSCRDQDGRTPLHLAVMKGRVEVVRELTGAKFESIFETLGDQSTVLHLCVKYNRLEALKLLVESLTRVDDRNEFVISKDRDGNTILHLASALKQLETIEYLFQIKSVKEHANAKNSDGYTALDILEQSPIKDLEGMEIRDFLLQAGVQRERKSHHKRPTPTTTTTTTTNNVFSKISETWKKHFKFDDNWLEESRGNIIMAATVIATMAFQAGLSPPGSVWQEYKYEDKAPKPYYQIPGTSIIGTLSPKGYYIFSIFNSLSFFSAICTILLAISGIPLKNRFSIWLLIFSTCIAVAAMSISYIFSTSLTTPPKMWRNGIESISYTLLYGWLLLCTLVMLIHTIRFLGWFMRKKKIKGCLTSCV